MQANRNILLCVRKKHPFTSYPAAKHPKLGKFTITDMREKLKNFSSRNNFANLCSFSKVSIPVETIIP